MTTFATRDELLGTFQRRYRELKLSGGRTVRIQNLSELERGKLIEGPRLQAVEDADRLQAAREEPARWVMACVVDADGKRMFRTEDIPALLQLDAADTRSIYVAAMEHVGTVPKVEDLEKNSGAILGDDSSSG